MSVRSRLNWNLEVWFLWREEIELPGEKPSEQLTTELNSHMASHMVTAGLCTCILDKFGWLNNIADFYRVNST